MDIEVRKVSMTQIVVAGDISDEIILPAWEKVVGDDDWKFSCSISKEDGDTVIRLIPAVAREVHSPCMINGMEHDNWTYAIYVYGVPMLMHYKCDVAEAERLAEQQICSEEALNKKRYKAKRRERKIDELRSIFLRKDGCWHFERKKIKQRFGGRVTFLENIDSQDPYGNKCDVVNFVSAVNTWANGTYSEGAALRLMREAGSETLEYIRRLTEELSLAECEAARCLNRLSCDLADELTAI